MSKINVLFDLQLSVLDSMNDGNFLMKTDSNVNVATFTIKNLLKVNKGLEFYVLVPRLDKTLVEKNIDMLLEELDPRVHFISYDYFGNPFMDRMTFNTHSLMTSLPSDVKIDLVYTNDPCKVLAYKTFFHYRQKNMVPIISRNHWVTGPTDRKVPEKIDFQLRQIEGAMTGDLMTFNSAFAADLFLNDASKLLSGEETNKIMHKQDYFEAVDIEKMDKHKTEKELRIFTILWAHRLSYYTGWEETLNALKILHEKRKRGKRRSFHVIVPDPGNKFTQEELKKRYPFIKKIDKKKWTHESYLRMCWKADVCLGNHKYPATWGGLAITEPMAAHTVPIMPLRHAYPEMYYDKSDYPIFFEDEKGMLDNIGWFMDNPEKLADAKKETRKFVEENWQPKDFAERINHHITRLCTSY